MNIIKKMVFLLTIGFVSVASAAEKYTVVEQKDQANVGTFRHIQDEPDHVFDIYAVTLNDKYRGRIFQQKADSLSSAEYLGTLKNTESFLMAINGSFYTPNFSPAGLFIENGKTITRLSRQKILNACVRVDNNKISLQTDPKNCLDAKFAMQVGPTLINQGDIADNLMLMQNRSEKLQEFFDERRRTVLAMSSDKKLIAIISTPITLQEMAKILKNNPELFGVKKIETAINLDGGASTSMYLRLNGNPFYFSEIRPVKTLIFFN